MTIRAGWRLLWHQLMRRRGPLAHLAAWSALESLPALASGLLVATALDAGFLAGRPAVGLGWLALLGAALAVRAVATRQLYPWLGEVVEPLRDALAGNLVGAAIHRGAADPRDADGAGVARLTEQVETVRGLVSVLLRAARQFLFTVVASLIGLVALAPAVALLVAPFMVVGIVLYVLALRLLTARQHALVIAGETIAQRAGAVLEGLRDVVACRAEDRAAAGVGEAIERQAEAERALARAGLLRTLAVVVGAQLPMLALLVAAPALLRREALSVATLVGALTYLTTSLEPAMRSIVHLAGDWVLELAVVLRRLAEVGTPPVTRRLTRGPQPAGHDLEVRGLRFAYSPGAEPVVRDLDLTVPYGTHLAIVGPSGIGKSTLANLLTGILVPQAGSVELGGVPLARIEEPTLRRVLALIPQEAYVFAGTLRENLAYLRAHVGDDELDAAATLLGLRPTIERLGGYDAPVGTGGATLSAGERQLVALTRVYLSRAEILVLDEATCHLDPAAEAVAEHALAERGGTLIVIAHRISSALRAERILVMDGADPQCGTHDSLVANSPLYADLVGHWRGERAPARRCVA